MAEVALTQQNSVALQLNKAVSSVLSQSNLVGFERAYATAKAIETLQALLTPEYMAPIMKLQGNRLGFKTDKDKTGGYPMDVVQNCLIEAVLLGLQPFGNQFNIIAGNTYATKEGCGQQLKDIHGLSYTIIIGTPRLGIDAKTSILDAEITWKINGEEQTKTIPISVKTDSFTSVDALKGKATRKARAWLVESITGIEVPEGDVQDIQHEEIKSTLNPDTAAKEKERQRVVKHIEKSTTVDELKRCFPAIPPEDTDLNAQYADKKKELEAKK